MAAPGSLRVEIRKATSHDKSAVVEFCRNTWPGGDYLPDVWDDWLKDIRGRLLVATVRGAPIGVGHGYFQDSDVVWLEGMRVHPAYRGHGIAGMINRALTQYAARKGAHIARLCTGSTNIASRHHAESVGFKVLQMFQRLTAKKGISRKPPRIVSLRKPTDPAWGWVENRPEMSEFRALYSNGWTWYPLTRGSLKNPNSAGRMILANGTPDLNACGIFSTNDKRVTIGFAAGSMEGLRRIAKYARYLVSALNYEKARALVPARSRLVRALEDSGFSKSGKILVYEKRLRLDTGK